MSRSRHTAEPLLGTAAFAAAILVCVAGIGCEWSHDPWEREAIEGRVTLDGGPLSQGTITFFPSKGTEGPAARLPRGNSL